MITLHQATTAGELAAIRALFLEYERYLQATLSLDLDFQGFEAELAALPGRYAPPDGRLFLARSGDRWAGCVALYRFSKNTCEIKRLYVRPDARTQGTGRLLLDRAIAEARDIGYRFVRLDSSRSLTAAARLYERYAFYEIEPYNFNPLDDVYYLEMDLDRAPSADN
jgi:GNAT superfamily N-acetyltransferase